MRKAMRRDDREIKDRQRINDVLKEAQVIHLGLKDGEDIYVVPLNYGYEFQGDTLMLYCHSAADGRKIDLIAPGASVGFSMECGLSYFGDASACLYGNRYKSIIGHGQATLITDAEARHHALNCIMAHYSGKSDWAFDENMLTQVKVIGIRVETFSCKIHE